ncbi:alpha/beta hydrolase [Streptomyces sp. SP18BB07]|uniref:alpha/beta hydrolase n=1 Tax=Streptomyces sp. SP18BB07 TaxID=3002522 RepID=UPI002E7A502C|nr:alpha/beta hydrolase-fold protein [Streptomyces sp. SP18BB07]MEE1757827.1 alpha/beta hydrolase-fold protein [Streptomyces sp. SP18BB07]
MPRSQAAAAELEPVDLTHGQVDEAVEMENFLKLNISGKDKAAYVLSYDKISDYLLCADSLPQPEVPTGQFYHFRWTSHTVYPGVSRSVWLYLPAGAEQAGSVNLLVCQDGPDYFGPLVNATTVLDNLVHRGEIPMTVGLFVAPGEQGPGYPHFGGDHNRSIEYDSVNADYARFLDEELFPVVRARVALASDPRGRVICGMSSGGACAVTAAFHRPDVFGNVISHCGSFINIRGAHNLPSMIRQSPRKAIRVWHQSGSRDLDVIFGSIPIANHDMAAALKYRRYDSVFEFGTGGHTLRHAGAVFPETLRWIFRDQVEDR